jgi:hypothetical protein
MAKTDNSTLPVPIAAGQLSTVDQGSGHRG